MSAPSPLPPYEFRDKSLEQLALTHRSFGAPHNERLEWLGDATLGYEISALLFARFPHLTEGGLSLIRRRLVDKDALARCARRLRLGERARLGKANLHDGRDNDNLLADMFEAYLAAISLDGGDARELLAAWFANDIAALEQQVQKEGAKSLASPKTRLQEFVQARKWNMPHYTLLKKEGMDDSPLFYVECRAALAARAQGSGRTRLLAEERAAEMCLRQLMSAEEEAPAPRRKKRGGAN